MNRRLAIAIASFALAPALAAPLQAGQPVNKAPPATTPAPASPTESDEDLRRMEATPPTRREEMRAAARTAADRIDARLRELQQRLDDSTQRMTNESRSRAEASLKAARDERARFAAQMARLDDRSNTALGDTKTRLVSSYRKLAQAVERAWARIQPSTKAPPAPPAAQKDDEDSSEER